MSELQGSGIPSNSIGVDGDSYVRKTLNGVVLYIKANGRWNRVGGGDSTASGVTSVNGETGAVILNLGNLGDVSVPSPSNGDVLTFDTLADSWVASPSSSSGIGDSFETVSKNLIAYRYSITYNPDGSVDEIVYTDGVSLFITKTFNYTGDKLTSIVLSGDTPAGIDLTKTFTYTGDVITTVAYS